MSYSEILGNQKLISESYDPKEGNRAFADSLLKTVFGEIDRRRVLKDTQAKQDFEMLKLNRAGEIEKELKLTPAPETGIQTAQEKQIKANTKFIEAKTIQVGKDKPPVSPSVTFKLQRVSNSINSAYSRKNKIEQNLRDWQKDILLEDMPSGLTPEQQTQWFITQSNATGNKLANVKVAYQKQQVAKENILKSQQELQSIEEQIQDDLEEQQRLNGKYGITSPNQPQEKPMVGW